MIKCIGDKPYSFRKIKHWVNYNFSRGYGKVRDLDWKSNWEKVRGNATIS